MQREVPRAVEVRTGSSRRSSMGSTMGCYGKYGASQGKSQQKPPGKYMSNETTHGVHGEHDVIHVNYMGGRCLPYRRNSNASHGTSHGKSDMCHGWHGVVRWTVTHQARLPWRVE